MKAPKFRDFITEQKKESYKLLVITDEPEKAKTFHTADRLREEAEKLGWDYYLYKLTGGYTTYNDGVRRFHNKEDKKGFVVDKDTVAIIRGSITRKDSWMDLISMLEKDGVCVVNSRQSVSVFSMIGNLVSNSSTDFCKLSGSFIKTVLGCGTP